MEHMANQMINKLAITIANLHIENAQLEAKLYSAEQELLIYRNKEKEQEQEQGDDE